MEESIPDETKNELAFQGLQIVLMLLSAMIVLDAMIQAFHPPLF